MNSSSKLKFVFCVLVATTTATGCNIVKEVRNLVLGKPVAAVAPVPSPSAGVGQYSVNAQKAKQNAELLHEMYLVVYGAEPTNRGEFGNYVDTLNQGASFEGVYNGFVHSSAYRKYEVSNPGSSYDALKSFTEELVNLQKDLPTPTVFSKEDTQPLPMPVSIGEQPKQQVPANLAKEVSVSAASDGLSKHFGGASVFVLKRVLGDEVLKVMSIKAKKREDLADWYAKWVSRLATKGVDFGISLRNSPDEKFHREWAMKASEDQIRWEALNRIHRLLNEMNKRK